MQTCVRARKLTEISGFACQLTVMMKLVYGIQQNGGISGINELKTQISYF